MGGKIVIQSQAKKLRAGGYSVNQISKKLGVSKSSVSAWVRNVPLSKAQLIQLKQRE